jgi:membrane dipeptidase
MSGPPLLPVPLRADSPTLAKRLGISVAAVELSRDCEIIDLHLDTFIPPRLWGYRVGSRHRGGPLGRAFFGHIDLPRLREGGLSGGMWSITTNPFRTAADRWNTFLRNVKRMRYMVHRTNGAMQIARTYSEYRAARARGAHAVIPVVQGANAIEAAPRGVRDIPDNFIARMTLVHLTNSVFGATSSPHHLLRRNKHLSARGVELVRQLNHQRVFVDLAHIHPTAFWDAVRVHDATQPLLSTHTGVAGVKPHWRNLDDAQLRAIADTGGTVGVIFSVHFLKTRRGPRDADMVIDHMAHIINTIGEDHVSVGSDFDGAIIPPADLAGGDHYPVLVEKMLVRGWSEQRIRKVLALNFLRCFEQLRP